mgnify:CR=1 FL=1
MHTPFDMPAPEYRAYLSALSQTIKISKDLEIISEAAELYRDLGSFPNEDWGAYFRTVRKSPTSKMEVLWISLVQAKGF